ncbi:hypothetical protein BDQ12DRAFT_728285 [Crucibulum laeve]|uniref:Uncharacterized protein n=1 Tax=Crucibulum laeve TaxID=68775 RepID=A0A5C3LIF7_9AGAR|nr:hypothetical protein BDQ12DRAFT_728285 [Crucibulum laeve]
MARVVDTEDGETMAGAEDEDVLADNKHLPPMRNRIAPSSFEYNIGSLMLSILSTFLAANNSQSKNVLITQCPCTTTVISPLFAYALLPITPESM